ncbi:N-acetylmuramoyl-L-alanine amidase [Peptococcaceae bacterium 1198_IL3148]
MNKLLVLALSALCLTMPISNHIAEAATNQTAVVKGSYVNLRSGPGTNHASQGQVTQGDRLVVLSKQGDWYQVKKSDGQTAWIASWLVAIEQKPASNPPQKTTEMAVVTGTDVNLRGGPGTSYPIAGQANQGDKLPILAKEGDWLKVKHSDGKEVWIAGWLAQVDSAPVATPNQSAPTQTIPNTTSTTTEMAVITGTDVNLRGGPGTSYPIAGQAKQGDKLPVLAKEGDWLKLKHSDGKEVWLAGWLAKVETVSTTVTPPTASTSTPPAGGQATSRGDDIERNLVSWLPAPTDDEETNGDDRSDRDGDKDQLDYDGHQLTDIEVVTDGDKTVITVEADTKLSYNTFFLSNPNRLVVNFEGVHLGQLPEAQKVNSSTVTEIRIGQFSTQPLITRMVLDLANPVSYRTDTTNQGQSLEIQLNKVNYTDAVEGKVIFIDAGHGGSDPGAPGYSRNTWEEDVNLDMALKLAAILRQQGAQVEMSRTGDQTVDLTERPYMANRINADIFVSIHSNANTNSSIRGTSTYFYAPSSRADLYAQRADRQRLAQNIQNEMVQYANLPDKNIREANFAVLRESKMPSVLVETAYISNPEEEKLLANSNFRQQVAEAIARGINAYFSGN